MADILEEQRHNLTHAVGECILAWASIEESMVMLFAKVLRADFWVACAVWDAIISFKAKRDALSDAIQHSEIPQDLKDEWKSISEKIKKSYAGRSEIAHSALHQIMLNRKTSTYRVIPHPSFNRNPPGLGLSELKHRVEIFDALEKSVTEFRGKL